VILTALCVLFSVLTLKEQIPEDSAAVAELVEQIKDKFAKSDIILASGPKAGGLQRLRPAAT